MFHACLPWFALCLAGAGDAPLEIVNGRATYGYLGAMRPKGGGILPGDTVFFTFEIKNLKLDETSKASYSIAIEIRDEQGKLFFEQKPYNSVARNYLGGDSLPCSAHVAIPLNAKPGVHEWKITVKDRATNKTATLAGKGNVLAADFGIVQVGLFADPEARVPTSAVGAVGDSFYMQFSAVGFGRDKDRKQPDVEVAMRILDEQGKPTSAKPISSKINTGVDPQERLLPVNFGLTLNRAGRFTIELSADDRTAGKTALVRYAIRVLPLDK